MSDPFFSYSNLGERIARNYGERATTPHEWILSRGDEKSLLAVQCYIASVLHEAVAHLDDINNLTHRRDGRDSSNHTPVWNGYLHALKRLSLPAGDRAVTDDDVQSIRSICGLRAWKAVFRLKHATPGLRLSDLTIENLRPMRNCGMVTINLLMEWKESLHA